MKLLKDFNKTIKSLKGSFEIILLGNKKTEDKYGITNTPSLVINEKIVSQIKVLTDRKIINYIKAL